MIRSHAVESEGREQHWAVVANPAAGRGRGERALAAARIALAEAGVPVVCVRTRDLEHARAAATVAAGEGGTVVAVGGDGLVGAVAAAVAGTSGVLGIVPAGRGNDFARSLGVPLDAAAASRTLLRARSRRVDVGEIDGRPFVGIASVGIDAEANRLANAGPPLPDPAVYAVAGVRALLRWRHATFEVEVDGTTNAFRGFAVGVGNSPFYGGGMRLLPDARVDDGLLDVACFGADNRLRFLRQIPQRRVAGHAANPTVSFRRGTVVRIAADRPMAVYADGEPIGALPTTATVRPRALRVLVPAS
ncbi:MAG TPA: diacylglycerol kinase family protein [Solirubrobacteraceae bacterium]|nr:diacylglycerol kinase family protein [Solirubrobacteraceae bacterium]